VRAFLPPLRERLEDLVPLSRALARELTGELVELEASELAALRAADFPGNVRELRALIEEARVVRWSAVASAPDVEPSVDLSALAATDLEFRDAKERVVDAFEREYVRRLLDKHRHNVSKAADEGGLSRNHLTALAKKHGLR
jgi:DNA-binding NtrC family response regulator